MKGDDLAFERRELRVDEPGRPWIPSRLLSKLSEQMQAILHEPYRRREARLENPFLDRPCAPNEQIEQGTDLGKVETVVDAEPLSAFLGSSPANAIAGSSTMVMPPAS